MNINITTEVKKNCTLQKVRKTVLVTNMSLPNSLQPVSLFFHPYWMLSDFSRKSHCYSKLLEFFLICVISMFAIKAYMIKAPTDSKTYRPNNEYILLKSKQPFQRIA